MSGFPYLWSHLSFMLVITAGFVSVCLACGYLLDRQRTGSQPENRVYRWRLLPAITLAVLAFSGQLSSVVRGPVDVSGHLLAFSGELSFGMLLFLATMLVGRVFGRRWRIAAESWHAPQWIWLLAGIALYSTVLSGRGPDVYSWGYGPALAWVALAASVAAACSGRWLLAVLFLGTVIVWQLGVTPSTNLWDYAIDPFIFAGAAAHILGRGVASRRRGRTKRDPSLKLATATTAAAAA